MGKVQLKKTLASFTKDQLIELVLEAYDASKDVKTYFEYFLNPDVVKLQTKYIEAIDKEMRRSKRSQSKARTSVIKKLLKDFASFRPGFDREVNMMLATVKCAMFNENFVYFSEAQFKAYAKICVDALKLADRNLYLENVLKWWLPYLRDPKAGTKAFREYLLNAIEEADFH